MVHKLRAHFASVTQAKIARNVADTVLGVDIRSEQVTLGDVAHITTRDLASLRRLVALSLGPTPRSGEVKALSLASLQDWVRRSLRLNAVDIAWTGADEVVIRQPLQTISTEQLKEYDN